MNRSRSALFALLFSPSLFAGEHPASFSSSQEVRLHLFSMSPSADLSSSAGEPFMPEETEGKKSAGLAAIYSLLLPGMGELYAGGFGSGKYFLIAESALWLTFSSFEIYGTALREDSRTFATSHAGVDPSGKDDQYYIDIGNFLDTDEYNQKQLQDRELEKVYDPAQGFAWSWDSDQSRLTYRSQRIDSEEIFNSKKFVVIATLVNHVASAINAARAAISHNNALDDAIGELDLRARVLGGPSRPHGILLTLSRNF